MTDDAYAFYYCQKLIVFSEDWSRVLLARRRDEADYNDTFTFVGGKMETTDKSILEGLKREKDEEIGVSARLEVYMGATHNILYRRKDGKTVVLPHYVAHYVGGEVTLNLEEYSSYQWVYIKELETLEPKVQNIPMLVEWALKLKTIIEPEALAEI